MEVRWEPRAAAALENIIGYRIEVAGKRSAELLLEKIGNVVGSLARHPNMGPVEIGIKGLRYEYRAFMADEIYKVIYRVGKETVYISALFDCRRNPVKMKGEVGK